MKQSKTIHTKRMMEVEGDYTFEVVICNVCGKELNGIGGWSWRDNEDRHVCAICGEGHWCNDHITSVEMEHASRDNDYEPMQLQLCPMCSEKSELPPPKGGGFVKKPLGHQTQFKEI